MTVLKKHPLSQVEAQVQLADTEERILELCVDEPKSKLEIANAFGHKSVPGNIKRTVQRLLNEELLTHTIPDRPRSSKQKYRITKKGLMSTEVTKSDRKSVV